MVNNMGSTQQDRSLSAGIAIPQWMKNKVWDRYEMEPFSPPSQDDAFYIRYPGMGHVEEKPKEQMAPVVVKQEAPSEVTTKQAGRDFTFHTRPCQEFIPNAPLERKPVIVSADLGKPRVKSQGTDDGFKGEGAACGKSVVEVAHQMIAEGKVGPSLHSAEDDRALSQGFNFSRRRGSKSLPASPLSTPSGSPESSPRQNRRGIVQQNRYFTSTFAPKASEGDMLKFSGSWLLSGLLGHQLVEVPPMASQDGDTAAAELRRNKSLSSLAVLRSIHEVNSDDESESPDSQPKVLKASMIHPTPSQLREMNFLSPTSM